MCFIFLIALFAPRVAFALMWLFTDYVERAFGGFLLPLLGLLFMPWTAIVYSFVAPGGISLINLIALIIAIVADIGSWGGGYRSRSWG